jgi:hypothetical protein
MQRQFLDILLDHDEAPELTGEEVVAITPGAGVGRLAPKTRRALERIHVFAMDVPAGANAA